MSGLHRFPDLSNCYLDGTLTKSSNAGGVSVYVEQLEQTVGRRVGSVQPQRGATVGREWVVGEEVHMFVQIEHVGG